MNRISRDQLNKAIALIMAQRGTCTRTNVGCVITVDDRVVATGYSGSPSGMAHCLDEGCIIDHASGGCIRTVHAEAATISFAARKGIRLESGVMYVTCAPCLNCAKLIINAGIRKVFYSQEYRDRAGVELLESAGLQVVGPKNGGSH